MDTITLPDYPKPKYVRFVARSVVSSASSPFTGTQQVYAHAGQWWEAEVALPAMCRRDAEPWIAALLSLNGKEGTFWLGDPDAITPRGRNSGDPVIESGCCGDTYIVTSGWERSVTEQLKAGDYVQVGAHLHKVLLDSDSDERGFVTLQIWPRLKRTLNNGEPVITTKARGVFRLQSNQTPWESDKHCHYTIAFAARESL